MPAPYWTTYPEAIALAGRRAGRGARRRRPGLPRSPSTSSRRPAPPRTKVLLFVSPSNPTGVGLLPRGDRGDRQWALERGPLDHQRRDLPEPDLRRRPGRRRSSSAVPSSPTAPILVNGVAKTYAMTGWRLGWMVGPRRRGQGRRRTCSPTCRATSPTSPSAPPSPPSPGPQDRASCRCARPSTGAGSSIVREAQRRSTASTCPTPRGAFYAYPDVTRAARAARWDGRHARRRRSSSPTSSSTRPRSRSCPARRSARRLPAALVRARRRRPPRGRHAPAEALLRGTVADASPGGTAFKSVCRANSAHCGRDGPIHPHKRKS